MRGSGSGVSGLVEVGDGLGEAWVLIRVLEKAAQGLVGGIAVERGCDIVAVGQQILEHLVLVGLGIVLHGRLGACIAVVVVFMTNRRCALASRKVSVAAWWLPEWASFGSVRASASG